MNKYIKKLAALAFLVLLPLTPATSPLANDDLLDLAKYKGKVVYLDFWASWCLPCKKSFPWMEEMQTKYQNQGLQVIAVNLDENQADADKFLEKFPVSFEIIRDPKATLGEKYSLKGMPTAILFDADGKQFKRHIGFSNEKKPQYEAEIRRILPNVKLTMGANQ